MNDLVQLIYVSSAKYLMTEHELVDLLKAARVANLSHGITGLLLYNDGNFMQVIEGERCDVDQLFKNIEGDVSHTGIIVLLKDKIISRDFSKWAMGFHNISGKELEGFSRFLEYHSSDSDNVILPGKAKAILMSFRG